MKFSLFIISFFFLYVSVAQQNSIMQPALKNSDQKLDSVLILSHPIFKQSGSLDGLSEKWIAKQYDSNKNPTEFKVYYYDFFGNQSLIDSTKVILDHYPYNQFPTDVRSSLLGAYIDDIELQSTGIYNMFNLKSLSQYIYNLNTEEWILLFYRKGLSDLKYPESQTVSKIHYYYDENFNITYVDKTEGLTDGNGYVSEKTKYTWDTQNGFVPDYKYIYYNTYDGNNQLQEVVKKRIDDLNTGTEINVLKYNFYYTSSLFEYTQQTWDENTSDWNIPEYKTAIEYDTDGNPVFNYSYFWQDGEWVLYVDVFDEEYYFNDGLYTGYSYTIPTIGDISCTLTYDNKDLPITENYIDINEDGTSGHYEGKEYYYSYDNGININDISIKEVVLYPNPAKEFIYIKSDDTVSYRIFSFLGELLKKGITNHKIDITGLKKGVYFIELNSYSNKSTKKFIVEP